ncbi:MAG: metal ABC transporter solute-binding protein, Zn/Mn family [Blautia sp.]
MPKSICDAIAETLEEMDPENKEISSVQCRNLQKKNFSALDEAYQETVNNAKAENTGVCRDRFPFRYLVDDCDLSYYAAFSWMFRKNPRQVLRQLLFLAGKVDELGVQSVLTMEKSDDRIAQTRD